MTARARPTSSTEVTFEDGRKGVISAQSRARSATCGAERRSRARLAGGGGDEGAGRPQAAAGEMLLSVEDVSLAFGGVKAITRRVVRHPQGRNPRHHRSERRRQDLDAQRHQRLLSSAARPHHVQGQDAEQDAARTRRRAAASRAPSRTSRCSAA